MFSFLEREHGGLENEGKSLIESVGFVPVHNVTPMLGAAATVSCDARRIILSFLTVISFVFSDMYAPTSFVFLRLPPPPPHVLYSHS